MGGEASEKAEGERRVRLQCVHCGAHEWFADDTPEAEGSRGALCDFCILDGIKAPHG